MPELSAELLAAINAAVAAAKPVRKAKGAAKPGRVKLSDEQKAVNAKANAAEAEALFTDKGYVNNVAHETIRTYGDLTKGTGWLGVGRKVKRGEKALKTKKGVALFHLSQTDSIGATQH